ncbi:phosphoadenosine phosphosulfate reductase family protein [Hoeflea poritis]|uniref:Phosphoadenosine phosphosulfate reductase family protein n=1 Tax=Hoeflea poritis TaxID=2993659 RepID=A0ABT4VMP2_9HYPH|nr:phosphoadenosine phosphosulfate reductase family protein [Hoeflea poritis]MDA4845936.1 phosphoadenosine phosphosulfate reductase family protein [Hoeflea poritis]
MNIASTSEVDALLASGAPVAIGVSGGKDSQAAALATMRHLDRIGHSGPRVLVHSDLGSVEWRDSLPVCERLAEHLGVELIVVKRRAGDMMDRWEGRWESSVRRYANLETVTLILPWSTPALRFCTSELKTHIIRAELRRRFKGQAYVNVTGVRRQESAARARQPVASAEPDGKSWNWRPIADWTVEQVFSFIHDCGLAAHPAYREFGLSRVSCRFCIMSNLQDLTAAAAQEESHPIYRRMVDLEIRSTFAFQSGRWLGDVAPHLLSGMQRIGLAAAKRKSESRAAAEARITKEMRYVKGWPVRMLTDSEAEILAHVRRQVSALVGFEADYRDAASIHARYAELMAAREARRAA